MPFDEFGDGAGLSSTIVNRAGDLGGLDMRHAVGAQARRECVAVPSAIKSRHAIYLRSTADFPYRTPSARTPTHEAPSGPNGRGGPEAGAASAILMRPTLIVGSRCQCSEAVISPRGIAAAMLSSNFSASYGSWNAIDIVTRKIEWSRQQFRWIPFRSHFLSASSRCLRKKITMRLR